MHIMEKQMENTPILVRTICEINNNWYCTYEASLQYVKK